MCNFVSFSFKMTAGWFKGKNVATSFIEEKVTPELTLPLFVRLKVNCNLESMALDPKLCPYEILLISILIQGHVFHKI